MRRTIYQVIAFGLLFLGVAMILPPQIYVLMYEPELSQYQVLRIFWKECLLGVMTIVAAFTIMPRD